MHAPRRPPRPAQQRTAQGVKAHYPPLSLLSGCRTVKTPPPSAYRLQRGCTACGARPVSTQRGSGQCQVLYSLLFSRESVISRFCFLSSPVITIATQLGTCTRACTRSTLYDRDMCPRASIMLRYHGLSSATVSPCRAAVTSPYPSLCTTTAIAASAASVAQARQASPPATAGFGLAAWGGAAAAAAGRR